MQSSALPAELQRQSVSLLRTAVMNRHRYIYLHNLFLVHQPAVCIDTTKMQACGDTGCWLLV